MPAKPARTKSTLTPADCALANEIRAEALQTEREAMLLYAHANRILSGRKREYRPKSAAGRVVAVLQAATEPLTSVQVARRAHLRNVVANSTLSDLCGDGRVIRLQSGYEVCRSLHQ